MSDGNLTRGIGPRSSWLALIILSVVLSSGALLSIVADAGFTEGNKRMDQANTWADVDRLVSEQKFQEALEAVEKLRLQAQQKGDEEAWTRGLVREVQLRTGLHGYETSVRFLREQPWPRGPISQLTLQLFYARCLVDYYRAYSWEINKRERVDTKGVVDLKAWTRDQLFAEAQKAYDDVWTRRAELKAEPVGRLAEYLDPNDYPAEIRGTIRDAVSYLYVGMLADTSFWRPEESNELYRLDLKALLAKGAGAAALPEATADGQRLHPLSRIAEILDDLERWHLAAGRRGAALEARLERLRRLHASFTEESDRTVIAAHLKGLLPAYREVPWWAMGQETLAEFVQQETTPGKLVRARSIAEAGWKAYPDSLGGQRCRYLVKQIEAPDFALAAMASDGPQRRSIRVTHQNLPRLYFRAYSVDLIGRVQSARDYNLLLDRDDQEKVLARRQPDYQWTSELPPTPDYEDHHTYVTPPIDKPGYYVVLASAEASFTLKKNRILSANVLVTDLVMVVTRDLAATVEVRCLSGDSGHPVSGVEVDLYRLDWRSGHRRAETKVTDLRGVARFAWSEERPSHSWFLLARKGADLALETKGVYFYRSSEGVEKTAALVYTDRSIYRPNQKIFWKILAYQGQYRQARFEPAVSMPATVHLRDANGESVDTRLVTTNEFGTASGEFIIPTGRMLGQWRVECSLTGLAYVRVEEYKRPTFEATFKDPESPLRLNRPATLVGEARYYFGLPVVSASVKWRITREPVYPWWWDWYGWGGGASAKSQTVAVGVSQLQEDGSFRISFTPQADEREAARSKEVSYRYNVTADVTDEGGETRSASKVFRLGFVSVEATIDTDAGFFRARNPMGIRLTRTDLNGAPRPGKGEWKLTALKQPETTSLPADLPLPVAKTSAADQAPHLTPGDKLRPRWDPKYAPEAVMRSWPDGETQRNGSVQHDAGGAAKVDLAGLTPGAYRLHYQTVDDFGETYRTTSEFVVADEKSRLALPALFRAERTSAAVGEKVRFLMCSGLKDQLLWLDIYRNGRLSERNDLVSERDGVLLELPITERDRGGFSVRLLALRDHQLMQFDASVFVPWDNRELKLGFSTFRDKIRPGARETWRVTVQSPTGKPVEADTAELLAYMYDRSLDVFAPHSPPSPLHLWPNRMGLASLQTTLGEAETNWLANDLLDLPAYPSLTGDRLKFYDNYGIGGPGMRNYFRMMPMAAPMARKAEGRARVAAVADEAVMAEEAAPAELEMKETARAEPARQAPAEAPVALRTEFSETAFWQPHLLTEAGGSVSIEFKVPDSVTSWNVWLHALTRDLTAGSLHRETKSVKELMVRPYVPRFLREGDRAELKVVVNNASDRELRGQVRFDILDPDTNESLLQAFGLPAAQAVRPFVATAGAGTNLTFPITAPVRVGTVAFKVTAVAGDLSDGELRPLPLLPGRMHLAQSRFVTLKNKDRREMVFEDLAKADDPSLINEQMVVTLDAQLFYSVLSALPYLVNFPYECTEQTLNRFVSTGILTSLYDNYPAVAKMAKEFAKRETVFETWDDVDPNRKMALEETPWLQEARGGQDAGYGMVKVLDPRIAAAERKAALAKLKKAQTASGGFPWWPGGPPSPYMTLYIMYGFGKAAEFGVEVPRDSIQRGWSYLASHFRDEYAQRMMKEDCCWEFLTFLNYVASCYPDPSWMGDALTPKERTDILEFCFKHWKQHSPYLKCELAMTLRRMDRPQDAALVFASVMDSARTTQDEGTFWAAEDRAWLWYNDTIETHAFALRTLMDITPEDAKKHGLVHWLFLNKKLNHWKSTRATAEVVYSLVHYLKAEGALGVREDATVTIGPQTTSFVFEPDVYTGKKNQIVIPGEKVRPQATSRIVVEKESKGLLFASATWHFSTEKLPEEERGDLLAVSRKYFKRENTGREFVLKPLADGATLQPGDEVEVQLSISAKHPCEYVHLRDPRAAGLEPGVVVSRYKWELGIFWYEETRDSGTNFFFDWLPQGEYTLKYRVRANLAGVFRVSPATLQSMYAPEFCAYSSGAVVTVK